MKVNLCTSIVLAVTIYHSTVLTTPVGKCPDVFDPDHLSFLPHTDCTKFYICSQSGPAEKNCPPGLHWNSQENVCDWPELAGCDPASSSTTVGSTSSSAPVTTTNPPDVTSTNAPNESTTNPPDETSTSNPAETSTNPPVETTTNPPVETSTCYPAETTTHLPEVTSTSNPAETSTNPSFETTTNTPEEPSTNAPAETTTNLPEVTSTSNPAETSTNPPVETTTSTPEEPSTNAPAETTTNPPDVTSTSSPIDSTTNPPGTTNTPSSTVTPTGKCPDVFDPQTVVLLPHAVCSKFYVCTPAGPVEMDCPAGLHWSQQTYVCEWPEVAGCFAGAATTVKPLSLTVSRDSVGQCPEQYDPENEVFLPHASDCTKYYLCTWGGVAVVQNCPAGLHWNKDTDQCDWPAQAGCALVNRDPHFRKSANIAWVR